MIYTGDVICGEKTGNRAGSGTERGCCSPGGRHFPAYLAGLTKHKLLMSEKEQLDIDIQSKPII